ncbi:PQQ-binding-like beta-propeller repeat protein [candidate division KSB1 bacterium]|nr:PQQ-binding-like beta-propeller repeat protein [candidate division KSB1 bacterium]
MTLKNTTLFLFLISCFTFSFSSTIHSQTVNWPMHNCDRARSNWNANEHVLYPPFKKTSEISLTAGGIYNSDMTYYDGLLCVATSDNEMNTVEAIDVASGDMLWSFTVPEAGGGMSFSCAQTAELVFAGGQHGLGLYALSRATGAIEWHKPMGNLSGRNLMLDGANAFIVVDTLYCISASDGTIVWQTFVEKYMQATPAIDDDYVYIAGRGDFRIFDKTSGDLVWERPISPELMAAVTVDNICFYTFSNDTVYAYDKQTRQVKWTHVRPGMEYMINDRNTFSVTNNALFVGVSNNGEGNAQLVCLNKINGTELWKQDFSGERLLAPVIANGVAYIVRSTERCIYGFDVNTGEQIYYDDSYPYRSYCIIADHKLIVDTNGDITIFENDYTPQTSGFNWPMLNYDAKRTSWVADETDLYPPLQITSTINISTKYPSIGGMTYYDGLLCVSTSDNDTNVVITYDAANGDSLWSFIVPGSGGSMVFDCAQNDAIVFAGGQNSTELYALNREAGGIVWQHPAEQLYGRNVMLDGGRAYLLSDSLYCFDVNSGATIWSTYMPYYIQTSPCVDNDYVYIVGKNAIRVYSKYTGELIWTKNTSIASIAGITADNNCFYTFSDDTVYAYKRHTSDVKWIYHMAGKTIQTSGWNSLAGTDEILIVRIRDNGEGNGQIVALNKSDGSLLWDHTFEGDGIYNSLIANNVIYTVPSKEYALYGLSMATGEVLFYDHSYNYGNIYIVADHKLFVARNSNTIHVFETEPTAIRVNSLLSPDKIQLLQNYPNPFNPSTTISFQLSTNSDVCLSIFNLNGQLVQTLLQTHQSAGSYQIEWNGQDLVGRPVSSGVYLCRLQTNGQTTTRKMLLMK